MRVVQVSLWWYIVIHRLICIVQGQSVITTAAPLDYNSCQSRCEESYFPGHPCYCNSNCQQFENCCEDYYVACKAEFQWSDEWSQFEGHSYRFFSDLQATYGSAVAACRRQGGLLVSVNSAEEQLFIQDSVLRQRTMSAFIGGSDIESEGVWRWADGTRITSPTDSWHFWYPGQPDNEHDNEDCTILSNYLFWARTKITLDNYALLDYNCAINNRDIQGYVCERTLDCEPNPCQNGGTCYYVGAGEDFLCECIPGFYGLNCEVELADGEMWTECGETELTKDSGVVTSPLYPRDYPPNVRCQWALNVGEGKTISLSIEWLDLEASKACFFDSLVITDGDKSSGTVLLGPVCGDNSGMPMLPVTTSGSTALIDFTTDGTTSGRGFRLTYEAGSCGRGSGVSGCGVPRTFDTDCGGTEFTQGPAEGATCQWDIRVLTGHFINLTFTDFNIPDTGPACHGGALVVYDGAVGPTSVLERACGRRFPWSVISTSSRLYLRLQSVQWHDEVNKVAFQYASIDASSWRMLSDPVNVLAGLGAEGSLSASSTPVTLESGDLRTHSWLVHCRVGDRLYLNWTLFSSTGAHLQIFDGHSVYSRIVTSQASHSVTRSGHVVATTFQLLVKVTSNKTDEDFLFDATYRAKEWTPVLSGCYRPLYRSRTDSLSTENSVVLPDQPVVVKVSESVEGSGYDPGIYCKWTVRGESGKRLALKLLNFDVPPNDPSCGSDGFVVYDPATKTQRARLCGASPELLEDSILSASNSLELYFYSDTRGQRRAGGVLRAVVMTAGGTSCDFLQMESSPNPIVSTSCGVLLSPAFPGMVPPGLWLWILVGQVEDYFIVNVHYVRGPALKRECKQNFQIREVPIDSAKLRQFESRLMMLCEDTDIFIPKYSLKIPPGQKVGIELNTITRSIYQRWEFKISYSSSRMQKPLYMEAPPGACQTGYTYYRGNCYLYETFVKRHYQAEEYKHQITWQASEERCRRDNATLLTLKDQEEADFIKYQFSKPWTWNPASPNQLNHRTVYLGLTNRHQDYVWNDGTVLGYSDWFQPIEEWSQPIVHDDEEDKYELLGLTSAEPKPDIGSVCTVMIIRSPFTSLNWVKMPCDYPMFRAGVICKKPATTNMSQSEATLTNDLTVVTQQTEDYKGCSAGWRLLQGICFRLYTNYTKVKEVINDGATPGGITQNEAQATCAGYGGWLALLSISAMQTLKIYLRIWRHDLDMGNIWLGSNGQLCRAIQVYKTHRMSEELRYKLIERSCNDILNNLRPYNVLCYTDPKVTREACTSEEYKCGNGVCISVDFVCDGHNDCFDNTDEFNCPVGDRCTMGRFRCDNGRCISMSLFCDKDDNCEDGSDESSCMKEQCGAGQFRCVTGECLSPESVCDFTTDCEDASDEAGGICDGRCRGFQCFSGLCLPSSMRHDVITDCPGVAQEDEVDKMSDLETVWDVLGELVSVDVSNTSYLGCPDDDQAQCMPGYDRCFRRADACVYDTLVPDEQRSMRIQASCREGSHLRTSCGALECPGLFKCAESYCVSYSKVCDGVRDCPRGQDEDRCANYTCPGLFHCKGESYCVPHDKVCNGRIDCMKFREDEKYCGITDILCKDACRCEGNVAFCVNITSTLPVLIEPITRSLRSIIVSESSLVITNETFTGLHWLGKLDLSKNKIFHLPINAFRDLTNLFELDLSGNEIGYFNPSVFNGLVSLRVLNIHNNKLIFIDKDTFSELIRLQHLIITQNPLPDVSQDAFVKLPTLKILNSDAYKFCCIAKHIPTCTPEPDEFSSCEDLMANYPLQVSIWILGFFAFAGNIFVVSWRLKTDRSKVSSFFIINLGCSDFFMGVYMLILASVDTYYRGQYIIHADKWRSSALCQLAGILATLSSEVSVFMLTVITADRLFVIMFPLKTKLRLAHARYVVLCGWSVCLILSIIPALGIPYFGDAFFGRSGVCLPFQMNNKTLPGWEYSVAIFLVMNLFSFLFIVVAYVIIFAQVMAAAKKIGDKATSTTDDISLAKKLMLIVFTDLLCWVPIILIGFVGLSGIPIPGQISAWVAVFVLPLNSAVNPILYTMSAIDCSRKKPKKRPMTMTASTTVSATSESTTGGKASRKSA